jgi:hypothetical protein
MNVMGGMFKDEKKQGNCRKQFAFVTKSYVHFQSFGIHNSMYADSVIEKLQQIAREKEVQRREHKQRQEEEVKLLRRTKIDELRRTKREEVLNI